MSLIISDEEYRVVLDSNEPQAFGMELLLDLAGCDPGIIRDPKAVGRWLTGVVDHIGMTRHGPAHVERFGEGPIYGTTGLQLITTSLVSIHAVDADNSAHINVFSCRPFDASRATEFCVDFFGARAHKARVVSRRAPAVAAPSWTART